MALGSRLAVVLLSLLHAGLTAQTEAKPNPGDAPDRTPSDFVRFVPVGEGGHLDTAITTYRKGEVEVVPFGAVHIADQACYDVLNDRFTAYEALLYELVGPADYRPQKGQRGDGPISMLQTALQRSLELAFQLDAIDYGPANFVHADMTPAEFEASMAERGESLMTIMLGMMLDGMKAQRKAAEDEDEQPRDAKPAVDFDLVTAFRSGRGRHTMRMLFASQLEQMEALSAGGSQGNGTLLYGRNEKCLQVLERELAAGKKKLGIYYGAAHLPHLEQRLVADFGFQKVGHEWLVAWDCTPRPDVKYDRELVQARLRCRDELAALAAMAREYRTGGMAPREVPTVAELAAAKGRDGAPLYRGPQQDPWGKTYLLRKRAVGVRWEAVSSGQDGILGTTDDLVVQEPSRRSSLFGR